MTLLTRTKLANTLPVAKTTPEYTYIATAALDLPDVQPGDVWTFDAGEEATSTYNNNVMVARFLKLSRTVDPGVYNTDIHEGILLAQAKGRNITWDIHHDDTDMSRTRNDLDAGPYRLILVQYAASNYAPTWTPTTGWNVAVTYVELAATLVYRPAPVVVTP